MGGAVKPRQPNGGGAVKPRQPNGGACPSNGSAQKRELPIINKTKGSD